MNTKLKITFPANLTDTPLTYLLIKKFDLKVNILKADIDFNNVGHILYEFTGDQGKIQSTVEYIKSIGIACESIKSTIKIDENLCTDCGLCTSVCFSKSLSIGAPDWTLNFDTDKCIGCNHCISVCPSRAIKEA